jgi:hypothetical protein
MSKAGIQSNRGDGYQTLVAFDWALTVLDNPAYEWIEVDTATLPVDDVVIGKADGSMVCCQCKKNQKLHEAWSVANLADELQKATQLLTSNPQTSVRFYSRSPFGELASLREFSTGYADESSYQANLGKKNRETDAQLGSQLAAHAPAISTYNFLRRTTFETSGELDHMEILLRERIRYLASNPDAAFDALWTRLDFLGMRADSANGQNAAIQHRLTKSELRSILHTAGSMLALPMDLKEVRSSFEGTSSIGRVWRRDIAGEFLSIPLVSEILATIDTKPSSILLTGHPGSGKTCVMLALQEALEQRAKFNSDRISIFIQSREFADLDTVQDRQAQGLPPDWVERTARLAEATHVVVVIDSLDVLSIAREHRVLDYFLAQMDRLLKLSNVTIITACRDFDRHYDRRIAERKWSHEFKCQPLDWINDIYPLLVRHGIETAGMDDITRQLIKNPRELALYVELASQSGSFNVVTSQALAQKYLDTIVLANTQLGNAAMQAIEAIATEMLRLRSLSVSSQRLTVSDEMRRALLSHNVLQQTKEGRFTFGHQTLLDVLVTSDALRQGKTLQEFIQSLPPVPFVRPSIRSFVAQLALDDRRKYRSQLRAALTSNAAFHIRRLIAKSFAEQNPQDEDWPLIRHLRENHPEIFQTIYIEATSLEWHHFGMRNLVPMLKAATDADAVIRHAHRVAQWKNEDPTGVLNFWLDLCTLRWINIDQIGHQIALHISQIESSHATLLAPLIEVLVEQPRQEHDFLGNAIARCLIAGGSSDQVLWKFIAGSITDDDVLAYNFNNKLHCQPHEFREDNQNFLSHRMQYSIDLLNLAIESIEKWSTTKINQQGEWAAGRLGFLSHSSYNDMHSQNDIRHVDAEHMLFNAVEAAVISHATANSAWWQENRIRLSFSHEGLLRYFSISACSANPINNLDLIGKIIAYDKNIEHDFTYEISSLIKNSFVFLDESTQDKVTDSILSIHSDEINEQHGSWIILKKARLISTIPCHLRSKVSQEFFDAQRSHVRPFIHQPEIIYRGGTVVAPFSFDIFIASTNQAILNLLAHYSTPDSPHRVDSLIGGQREVAWQLKEATSRAPCRFINFMENHWPNILNDFCEKIIDGASTYLAYKYGNLQTNAQWNPIETPDAQLLSSRILEELERHPHHWRHNRTASNALQACAHVIVDTQQAERLVFLTAGFINLREQDPVKGDSVDLLTVGINMMRGHAVEALMIILERSEENGFKLPELTLPLLYQFARDDHPAIRALILRRLPYLQSHSPDIGWRLFDLAMQDPQGLWKFAEPCFYHAYHNNFDIIKPWFDRLYLLKPDKGLATWGRISSLASLDGKLNFQDLVQQLQALDAVDAWRGAAAVWTHPENIKNHRQQCISGLEAGLSAGDRHALAVAQKIENLFRRNSDSTTIPTTIIHGCFAAFEIDTENRHHRLFGFDAWLNKLAQHNPNQALEITEIYLSYIQRTKPYLHDHDNQLPQLLQRLFSEAEESEEEDQGAMLKRVVTVQDILLGLGVNGVEEWLKASERP